MLNQAKARIEDLSGMLEKYEAENTSLRHYMKTLTRRGEERGEEGYALPGLSMADGGPPIRISAPCLYGGKEEDVCTGGKKKKKKKKKKKRRKKMKKKKKMMGEEEEEETECL